MLAGAHPLRRARCRLAIDAHLGALDEPLQMAARELRREGDDRLVETLAVQCLADRAFARLGLVVVRVGERAGSGRCVARFGRPSVDPIRFAFHVHPLVATALQVARPRLHDDVSDLHSFLADSVGDVGRSHLPRRL